VKKLGVGVSDFKKLIETDCLYTDKSLIIRDLCKRGTDTYLFLRPRRFGKSLTLSMLKYFLEIGEEDHSSLFSGLKVWENEDIRKLQGKYPVIFFLSAI
jgi:hypothetical protein